ncbi:MAG: fibronectin type III domain-containing protein [Lachnospiraceae bacterium]|nr:fibronectin type III domain-containing protein [Lachnospiraceae bacterium]
MEQLNLTATLNKNGSITAKWNKIKGAVKYKAYMYPTGKSYAIYNEDNLKTTSYTSKAGLPANQQYKVCISAYGSSYCIASEMVKVMILSDFYNQKPLAVPQNIKAEASPASIKISFDKVTNASSYDILFDDKVYSMTTTNKTFWNLKPKTTHTYAVRAKNANQTGAYSTKKSIKTLPQTPAVPSNIKKSSTENSVTVSWSAATAATSYDLVFGGKTYSVTGTSKVITGLSANTTYTFMIRAKNADAVSAYSSSQTVKTTPKAPSTSTVTANENSVTISWSAVSGATGYDVILGGKTYSVTGTSKVITGLSANTSYTYQIRTKNANGVSTYCTAKTIKTAPVPPTTPSAAPSQNSVTISWSAVSGATSYDIIFNGTTYRVNGTSKTFTGLTPGMKYTYQIRSNNSSGSSSYSAVKNVTTLPKPPVAPTNIEATSTENSVTIKWGAVTGATSYDVLFENTTYNVTSTSKTITGLQAGMPYFYSVRANNSGGSGEYSALRKITTLIARPEVPANVNALAGPYAVKISWSVVRNATSYDVWFNGTVYNVNGLSKTIDGLTPSTSYTYKVLAKNSTGNSAYSATQTVKTLVKPPTMPTNVSATATTDSVTVKWSAVSGAAYYTVRFDDKTQKVNGTSVTFTGLDSSTDYVYSVCASNAGGTSAYSVEKTIRTLPVVPDVPWAFDARAEADSVTVRVFCDKDAESSDIWFNGTLYNTTTGSYTITGLTPNTEYSYKVRAKNSVGASAYSEVQNVRTLLETPTNILAKAKSKKVTISFNPVVGATNYDIVFDDEFYNITETSKEFTGLYPETEHTYFVRARNEYVESQCSKKESVTTLPPGPEVPSDVDATATMNAVIVSFSPVEEATDYDVEFDGIPYHVTDNGEVTFVGEEDAEEVDILSAFSVLNADLGTESVLKTATVMNTAAEVKADAETRIYKVFVGLLPDTKHTYCARANNAEGSSRYSERKTIYTEIATENDMDEIPMESTYPSGKKIYTGADPVNALTGAFLWSYTWLEDHGKDKLHFTTMYDSQRDDFSKALGKKWTYSLNYLLSMDEKYAYFSAPGGGVKAFRMNKENGTFESTSSTPSYYSMKKNEDGSYSVWERGGTEYIFDSNCRLNRIVKNGLVEYQFTADLEGRIVRIEGRHGASLNLTYAGERILSVADAMGNKVTFTYKKKCLGAVVNPGGKGMTFTYDNAFNLLTISDFSGKTYLTNKYDVHDRVKEQHTAGRGKSLVSYDKKNRVTTFTDELGNDTKYTYDENGHMVKVELAGASIQNSYNEYGQLTKRVDALGNVTQMEYDACGRMTHVIHPDGTEEQVEYNVQNMPVKVVNRDGTVNMYYYDENNNLIAVQDELGHSSTYSYDDNDNLVSFMNKKGDVWTCIYDENNHLKQVTDPEGRIYQYSHDAIGRLIQYTSAEGRSMSYQYSEAGDLLSIEDADGAILFEYNENGSRTGITDKMGNKQRLEYNEMGQISLVTDFLGNEYRFEYDAKGNLIQETDPLGNSVSYAYDAMGNRTTWTDKNGNTTGFTFDAANQLTEVRNAAGGTVKYVYDTMGRVKTVIDPLKRETAYTYDHAGRVTGVTDALGNRVSYTYDKAGNLLTKTNEDGAVTAYAYDAESRLTSVQSDAGTMQFAYDSLGRVIMVEDTDEHVEVATYDADGNLTAVLDKEKNRTTYAYDKAGRLVEMTAPNGAKTTYAYDKNGNCVKVTDAENNEYSYEYDANNRLVKVTNPLNQQISYIYDATGNLLSVTDAKGGVTAFAYDGNGNLIRETNPLGGEKVYTYDNLNRLTEIVDEEGHKRSFAYDAAGNMTSYTDANENQWNCAYDALNRVKSITDRNGGSLTLDYTKTGRLSKVTDQEGAETSYLYDSMGRLVKMSDALGHSLSFTYDSKGRILTQTDANGNTTEYSYSPTGKPVAVKDPEGNTTTYTYNALGQMLTATDPLGNTTTYAYDMLGQVTSITDAEGGNTSFTYTANGQIATVTDANGGVTEYSYDACGNLVQTKDPLGNVVMYEYDAMNNQIKECQLISGEQTCVTLYRYDKRGCRVREIDPVSEEKAYTYDGNGNVVSVVDEEKNETAVRYDLNNRPVHICYGDGKETTFRYNKRGELVEMTDWSGMVSMERDLLGRVTKVTDPDGHATGYAYDGAGNRTGIRYPDGSMVSYAYDKNNRLAAVTDGDGQSTKYAYDASGRILSVSQPGSTAAYTYNGRRQPVTAEYRFDDGTVMTDSFAYDLVGRMTGSERKGTTEELTGSAAYAYDAIGQLVSYREGQNTETYVYDALGNRISKAINGTQKATYQYNPMNQLISMMEDGISYSFGYDRRGNLTEERKGESLIRNYTYDATNRMVSGKNLESGETTEYGYNGLMMRVRNVQNLMEEGATCIKEKGYVVDYLSGDRNDLMVYEKGAGATRAVYGRGYECLSRKFLPEIPTATGEKKYFQSDLYGSALFASNEKGEMLRYAKRGVWGERNGAEEEGLRFTTYSHDPVIGKYFAQARFYDSRQGRMLAKDPVKNGLNAYAYCGNDPVNLVDPSGKIALTHLLKSVGAGLLDGVCDFGESAWNQYKNGGEIDWLDALGAGAKGFAKGTVEEFFLGSKTKRWMMAVADFGAGTFGSLAEQFISGDGLDFGDAFHDGIMNTVEGQAFGKRSVDGVWDALKRGSKAGAATSIVDNVYGALTAGKNGGGLSAGTGMLGLALNHGISQGLNRDPKTACGSSNPFHSGLNFNGGYGNGSYAGSRRSKTQAGNGWSLENAIKDVANDTIWGGLGSVAQYAGGTFFEAVGNSIFGRSKSGKATDFYVTPSGDVVPATGYRYMDSKYAEQTMESMSAPGSYFGFEKYDSASAAQDAFQIAPEWSNCKLRGEFDTLQVIDGMYVPKAYGDKGPGLEPFTRCYPEYGKGGCQQFIYKGQIYFKNVDIIND